MGCALSSSSAAETPVTPTPLPSKKIVTDTSGSASPLPFNCAGEAVNFYLDCIDKPRPFARSALEAIDFALERRKQSTTSRK